MQLEAGFYFTGPVPIQQTVTGDLNFRLMSHPLGIGRLGRCFEIDDLASRPDQIDDANEPGQPMLTGVGGAMTPPTKLTVQMAAILFVRHFVTLALAFNQSSAEIRFIRVT